MRSPRPWLFAVVLALIGLVLAVLSVPGTHGHGHRAIRVTGRLVEAGSGQVIAGARVLTVSAHDLERDWDPEGAWLDVVALEEEQQARRDAGEDVDPYLWVDVYTNAGSRSDGRGGVDLLTSLGTTRWFNTLYSLTDVEDPEDAVAALWIAVEGREPVVVLIGDAVWSPVEDAAGWDDLWGAYDFGTLEVPAGGGR